MYNMKRMEVLRFKTGPGRPRTNWWSMVNKDLLKMGVTWEEAEVAAQNRSEWRRSVGQCGPLGCGLNQGQGHEKHVMCSEKAAWNGT